MKVIALKSKAIMFIQIVKKISLFSILMLLISGCMRIDTNFYSIKYATAHKPEVRTPKTLYLEFIGTLRPARLLR